MNLSLKQREIVEADGKYIYVVASAGSGKTRTLIERITRLLSVAKRGEKVLALTFSNKAAKELKDRLLQVYTQSQINELVYIGTIHNFCMEIVLQRGSSINLPKDLHIFEEFADRLEIFKSALEYVPQMKAKYQNGEGQLDAKKVQELFELFSKAKRDFKFPEDYVLKPLSQRLYQEFNSLMLSQNAIDFDDILLYAYRIMIEKPAIASIYQRIYRHICVDEAQDLNRSQYAVIKAIAGESSGIFMVGDPNQAIYGFNGSSSRYMCIDFPSDYNARKYELVENYRSSQAIIRAAKSIEPSFDMKGQLPIKGDIEIKICKDEASEAAWISERIDELLSNGHPDIEGSRVLPQQFAVLARNRYVFSALTKRFEEQHKEYNLRASSNNGLLSESLFFKLFDLSLRVIMNARDLLHLSEMRNLLECENEEISSLEDIMSSKCLSRTIGCSGAEVINAVLDNIQKQESSFRFDKALDILKSYCNDEDNFSDYNERSMVYNDYLLWCERWLEYVRSSSVEERSLMHMMRSIALGVTNISKEAGITLSTVHMSKGLEFDIVFIMGLTEGVFPDYRSLNNEAQLNEEQHNMFVSITRSKRLCYLSYAEERVMPWGSLKVQKPSRYVDQLRSYAIIKCSNSEKNEV